MIGAVQENDTSTSVNAIKNIEMRPVACEALESTELAQLSGNLISNQPKNEKAKATSNANKKMLKTAFVESSLSLLGPKRAVMTKPKPK